MNDFDPTLPLALARTIPAAWYISPLMAERERQLVFGKSWQIVARADQLARPGDYITVSLAGEPLLLVRGDDNVLRGFFNVCRHRAAPLLTESCGSATKLRCRYHGWTYDLAGCLRGTPEFDGVEDFDKSTNGLVPIAVESFGPLVAVNLSSSTKSLKEHLAPLPEWTTAGQWLEGLRWHARREYDLACNWKVYVDNYLDGGYHVNTVHPALADVLNYSDYTTTTHGFTALQASPLKPAEGDTGRTRSGDLAAYWWVYPNFMLNLYRGVMDTNLVLPLGADRCRVIFDFYFADQFDEAFRSESIAVADRVQAEDIGICEDVQRGLHSRSYSTGRFSKKRENAGYYFHRLLAQSLSA
jgi:choline monooxygenase